MGFQKLFTDVITKLETILVENPIATPKTTNNYQKTKSNVNQVFKTISIWNDQIDEEIKGSENAHIIKCPAIFIEFIPEEPKMILGGVTQYMDAKMYFHIFSDQLNTPNNSVLGRDDSGDLMDVNLEIYDLRDTVKSVMLGFHTDYSSFMMSRYDALDYKHKTITKFLLGFTFCFNDIKGSIYDPKSSRYLMEVKLVNPELNVSPKNIWISGTSYVAIVNTVYLEAEIEGVNKGYYLCLTSNSDVEFTASNWQELTVWLSSTAYTVGNYIYIQYFIYVCLVDNSDVTFNPDNWELINRI